MTVPDASEPVRSGAPRPGPGRHRATAGQRRLRRVTAISAAIAVTTIVALAVIGGRGADPAPAADPGPTVSSTAPTTAARPPGPLGPPAPAPAAVTPQVPAAGTGRFEVAVVDPGAGSSSAGIRYSVEVEGGVPFAPDEVAAVVDRTLRDDRGWAAEGAATFARVEGSPNMRVILATPATVDRLCAPLQTGGEVSCRNGDLVVLNAVRWAEGSSTYGDDVTNYRRYLINHEIGHRLGRGHEVCPRPGDAAPVMVQQTKSLERCLKNPWP